MNDLTVLNVWKCGCVVVKPVNGSSLQVRTLMCRLHKAALSRGIFDARYELPL